MSDISTIARHWARQTELGRGIRLSTEDLDLLNAVGVDEILSVRAAEQRSSGENNAG